MGPHFSVSWMDLAPAGPLFFLQTWKGLRPISNQSFLVSFPSPQLQVLVCHWDLGLTIEGWCLQGIAARTKVLRDLFFLWGAPFLRSAWPHTLVFN